MTNGFSVAILGAVAREVEGLLPCLEAPERLDFHGTPVWTGTLQSRRVIIGTAGFNKVNAAITTSALLERFAVGEVWCVGCAGAYAESPLRVGDVLVSERVFCGDEGVLTARGVLSCAEIGIPILTRGGDRWHDEIPVDPEALLRAKTKTPPGERIRGANNPTLANTPCDPSGRDNARQDFRLFFGPSLTVGMASGDADAARKRFLHYGAFAENMEGSAIAQACFRFQTPMLECRGMSNVAGDRRKERWELGRAIANSHSVVLDWL